MMQYYIASCPDRFMILPYTPKFGCPHCKASQWGATTGFDTPNSRKIWVGESICLGCQKQTKWLLNPDLPMEMQTDLMHRPFGDLTGLGTPKPKPSDYDKKPPEGVSFNDYTSPINKKYLDDFINNLKSKMDSDRKHEGYPFTPIDDLPKYDKNGDIIFPPQSDYDSDED